MTNRKKFEIIYELIAAMAQLVERVLGKDEVPGSNPGSSSKKKSHTLCGFFFLYFSLFSLHFSLFSKKCVTFPDKR